MQYTVPKVVLSAAGWGEPVYLVGPNQRPIRDMKPLLIELRSELKLSTAEMAEVAGVPRRTFEGYFYKHRPTLALAPSIVLVFAHYRAAQEKGLLPAAGLHNAFTPPEARAATEARLRKSKHAAKSKVPPPQKAPRKAKAAKKPARPVKKKSIAPRKVSKWRAAK